MKTAMKMMDEEAKRAYRRRTDEERLTELQDRLSKLKDRVAERRRKDSPLHRELSRTRRTLRGLAQTAQDNGRADISNSTLAFLAGLERMVQSETENGSGRGRQANGA